MHSKIPSSGVVFGDNKCSLEDGSTIYILDASIIRRRSSRRSRSVQMLPIAVRYGFVLPQIGICTLFAKLISGDDRADVWSRCYNEGLVSFFIGYMRRGDFVGGISMGGVNMLSGYRVMVIMPGDPDTGYAIARFYQPDIILSYSSVKRFEEVSIYWERSYWRRFDSYFYIYYLTETRTVRIKRMLNT